MEEISLLAKSPGTEKSVIENTIEIKAAPGKVWRVFTDPDITKELGGEYLTDWKEGSSFGWKNIAGEMLTNGIILKLEAEKLLQHNLYSPDNITVISIITYRLSGNEGLTILNTREELLAGLGDKDYDDALKGWRAALNAVKTTAEKL